MKRPGEAEPAIHHTMLGERPLFQAIASAITLEAPSSSDTSAEMYWNRWVGEVAAACADVRKLGEGERVGGLKRRGKERGTDLYFCERGFEFAYVSSYNDDTCSLFCKLNRDAFPHSF